MKIRIMGTKSECEAAREYYAELEKESGVKSVSISENYPNRGSNTIFRVYVDVEYYDAASAGSFAGTKAKIVKSRSSR